MQAIGDPDLFELSEIVQKSSKSGIFSNTRLLMIKDGFLYYFSKVPQDYKGHQPNLMSSLKEYPKSSIEVRHIRNIRLESPKSSTLIIEFMEKDMIDRQDIRKSLSSKNFNTPVKEGHNELQEWKFTFSNFSKCKQWYFALQSLKTHFQKHQDTFDRFTEYMANFDNDLRKSLPRHSPSNQSNLLSLNSNSQLSYDKGSGNSIVRNGNIVSPSPKPNNFPSVFVEPQIETKAPISSQSQGNGIIQKYNIDKPGIFAIQQEEEQDEDITMPAKKPDISKQQEIKSQSIIEKLQTISLQGKQPFEKEVEILNISKSQQLLKAQAVPTLQLSNQNKEQEKEKLRLQTQEAIARAVEQARQHIVREQRRRAQEQAMLLQRSLEEKEEIIQKMQEQIQLRKKAQIQLQDQVLLEMQKRQEEERMRIIQERQKRQEDQYKRLQQSIGNEPSIEKQVRQTHQKEESIQTEFQKNFIDVLDDNGFTTQRLSRYSAKSGVQGHEISIEAGSSHIRQQISQLQIENFDYFWQLGQIYKQNDSLLKANKQLALAQFVRKATRISTSIVANYIDENKPCKMIKIDRHIFEIQIVCQKGQTIRTHGQERLIYPNENHQKLKRTFKIYNQLNDLIINNLKKKPNYPLRVPFCCLVQYKGYTALVQTLPARTTPAGNNTILKSLGPGIPSHNFRLLDFEAGDLQCCLLLVINPYKCTKLDQNCLLKEPLKTLQFIQLNRRHNISLQAKKLFEEAEETACQERNNLARIISWVRQLKKYMKSSTPFVDSHRELEFFDNFLERPQLFIESAAHEHQLITGIFLFYCEKLLGLQMKTRIDSSQFNYSFIPTVRGFTLSALDISLFASKMEKLCLEGKFELAQMALKYSKQILDDYAQILMKQIYLDICKGRYSQAMKRIDLTYQIITPHDPRTLKLLQIKAQCCQALGQHEEVLSNLKNLLQRTEYMYRDKFKLVQIYFLIAGTLSRQQLNKELVEVYRKILKQSPSHRHRVILQFSQSLLAQKADPHTLLDFIQQEHQESSEAPQTQILLGDIYFKCKNYQKAISYYEKAFDTIINIKTSHPDLFSAYQRLVQFLPSTTQKKTIHRQLLGFSAHNNLSKDLILNINTLVSELICKGLTQELRQKLVRNINQKGKQAQSWIGHSESKVQEWAELQRHINGAAKSSDDVSLKNLIQVVDCNKLAERCLMMNRSELL